MGFYLSAGVYPREIDLSNIVTTVSTSVGAVVGYANRGPLTMKLNKSTKDFIERYGKPLPDSGTFFHYTALGFMQISGNLYARRVVKSDARYGGFVAVVSSDSGDNMSVSQMADPTVYSFAANELFLVYPENPGVWNKKLSVNIENVDVVNNQFDLEVTELLDDGRTVIRELKTVSRDPAKMNGYGKNIYIETAFENSEFIRVKDSAFSSDVLPKENNGGTAVTLTGGDDGAVVGVSDTSEVNKAWDDFANPDVVNVNILLNGGYTGVATQTKMDTIANSRKDCVAILDIPALEQDVVDVVTYRRTTLALNSSYSALYTPWIKVKDDYNDRSLFVPPSGYIGGTLAYTDAVAEPWSAPAGPSRGLIPALELEKYYTQDERDTLYEAQVNMVRKHPSGYTASWGQKMLKTLPSALDRMNVRRLMIVLEKAITIALDAFLFEPNDFGTRLRLTNMIEDYLRDIYGRGGIQTNADGTPGFSVVADERNNTSERIDRNELWVDIYIKPIRAAEFIQLSMIITKSGASFSELIAQAA